MKVEILSPEAKIFTGEAKSVKVPGASGQFEILSNHAPIVSALAAGTVRVKTTEGKEVQYNINGGFVEVLNNEISLLVTGVQA
jgi:F-type H+-transporting ATPase subunit epsilon